MSPEQNAKAEEAIALLRAPEEEITTQLLQIQQDNSLGGYLVGLDHRIKGAGRLKEKLVDELKNDIGASIADAAEQINDAVRYTFCFGIGEYLNGYHYVRQRLESAGYEMTYSKNHWLDDPDYKGINSRWKTPDGARFEMQFHIPDSFYAKEFLTHCSYDRLRTPGTNWQERVELESYQRTVSTAVPQPYGVATVIDRKERF